MYIDALLLLSDAQAFSATGVSTNTVDLGAPTVLRRVGDGEELGIGFSVDVAADAANADETYEFQAVSDDAAALSSTTLLMSQTIARATLVAGYRFFLPIPKGFPSERYIGARLVLGGTTPSITVTAWVTTSKLFSIEPRAYTKGYSN